MKLRNMLIISVFLHACFFTAALLLSENLLEGSSKMFNERVFFVKITAGVEPLSLDTSISRNRVLPKPVSRTLSGEDLSRRREIQSNISSTLDETNEGKNDLNTPVLSVHEEPANSVLNAGSEIEKNHVEFSYGEYTAVNIYYNQLFSESRAASESDNSKGGLSAGIIEIIRSSIERAKTYPVLARKRGVEGTVYVSFRINSKGEPHDIKVLKGSGYTILDNATVDIVRKAAPFPHIDNSIEIPVVFRLE